ncbi:MAG TPA: hypothetical protein VNY84_06245 [Acidimicrobiales bacterium]|jgi:hypothetical protein|nr:hypothetical protein [Acidimicrobiales bacterium]
MDLVLAAKVWHYWISIALIVPIVGVVVAIVIGYLVKVVGPRYQRR